MSDRQEFTHNGETYYFGRKVGPADFGMVPEPPPGLREAWSDGPAPQWEITVGDEGEKA
jgi:hypothetical protein